ncbi:uncharacterized protein N7477_003820 [Penicillium maclennaniae]|uniref:uncharacterized protein n=1 Tax=Penicillium maclennaniae TaxID=1343394 RepID=UPI002542049F|nr:uncharacterized protein N7477_003820 [Penicillium maclennaniae]KAJ5678187.1 hypothetical protein N7477_003820 [Penicillium maclennaniae]
MSSNGYLTKESILALGVKDPEYAEWQKANPEDDEMDWSNIKSARAAVDEWSREQCASLPDQGILMNISMRDGYQSSLRIFKPTSSEYSSTSHPSSPVIVLIYGGAFCCGDNSNFAAQALALRALYGATVVLTSHRLVPEHPFPVGQQDIWDSLVWLAENAESVLGADMNAGFIVGGVSSGGNTAATVGQMWVDEYANEYSSPQGSGRPKLTGMWLSVPFLFSSKDHVPQEYQDSFLSREQFKGDSTSGEIPAAVVKMQQWDTRSRWYSPINSPNPEPHKSLAKHGARVYFQAAGRCFARDDSLIYERMLAQNGVETKLDIYPGCPHAHFAGIEISESRRCNLETFKGFAWLLRKDVPSQEHIESTVRSVAPSIII